MRPLSLPAAGSITALMSVGLPLSMTFHPERQRLEPLQKEERVEGAHGERQWQQDRDAVGATQTGQHTDDHAEDDADNHQHEIERLQDHRKTVEQITDIFEHFA